MAQIVLKKGTRLQKRDPKKSSKDRKNKIRYWLGRSEERGASGSKCVQLKYAKDLKAGRLGSKSSSFLYAHPRQVIFLHEHKWLPRSPYCISHQCGDTYCIAVGHYVVELSKINLNGRKKCHGKIKKWIRKNRRLVMSNSQWTIRKCKLAKGGTPMNHVCVHSKFPCFISVNDAKLEYF